MRGFIEVTPTHSAKKSINVSHIISFEENLIYVKGYKYPIDVEESYVKIKQLIWKSV